MNRLNLGVIGIFACLFFSLVVNFWGGLALAAVMIYSLWPNSDSCKSRDGQIDFSRVRLFDVKSKR